MRKRPLGRTEPDARRYGTVRSGAYDGPMSVAEPQVDGLEVTVGGLSRDELLAALDAAGIRLNTFAETLLAGPIFATRSSSRRVRLAERSPSDLGLPDGGSLSQIHRAARNHGLLPCPLETAPYLRLALTEQDPAPDSLMSTGRAPAGSLTVASPVDGVDDDKPKGFYLRVVDGQPWLRGFRCDDAHVWSPGDRFVFRSPD